MICCVCGDVIEDEDDSDDEFPDADDEVLGISEKTCSQCKKEMREGVGDFLGDFNEFHPDETDEEFWDHEE